MPCALNYIIMYGNTIQCSLVIRRYPISCNPICFLEIIQIQRTGKSPAGTDPVYSIPCCARYIISLLYEPFSSETVSICKQYDQDGNCIRASKLLVFSLIRLYRFLNPVEYTFSCYSLIQASFQRWITKARTFQFCHLCHYKITFTLPHYYQRPPRSSYYN